MSNDWYSDFVNSGFGKSIAGSVGLPPVPQLRRYEPGQPLLSGPALLGTATADGRVAKVVRSLLTDLGIEVHDDPNAAVGGGVVVLEGGRGHRRRDRPVRARRPRRGPGLPHPGHAPDRSLGPHPRDR